jgi:16S rRNA processing protein RimM
VPEAARVAPVFAPASFVALEGLGFAEGEVELGEVTGAFSFRGELRLFLHHRGSSTLEASRPVTWVAPDGRRYRGALQARSGAGQRVLGRVPGLQTEADALALRGWRFGLAIDALPALPDGEWYVASLIGCEVVLEGARLGRVVDVHETAGGDVVEVDTGGEASELFVLTRSLVVEVDAVARRIVVRELPWDPNP